jgi:hypothetical protein
VLSWRLQEFETSDFDPTTNADGTVAIHGVAIPGAAFRRRLQM